MKAFCKKCGKNTEFLERETSVRAGDNGFTKSKVYTCKECKFSPLFMTEAKGE